MSSFLHGFWVGWAAGVGLVALLSYLRRFLLRLMSRSSSPSPSEAWAKVEAAIWEHEYCIRLRGSLAESGEELWDAVKIYADARTMESWRPS